MKDEKWFLEWEDDLKKNKDKITSDPEKDFELIRLQQHVAKMMEINID